MHGLTNLKQFTNLHESFKFYNLCLNCPIPHIYTKRKTAKSVYWTDYALHNQVIVFRSPKRARDFLRLESFALTLRTTESPYQGYLEFFPLNESDGA